METDRRSGLNEEGEEVVASGSRGLRTEIRETITTSGGQDGPPDGGNRAWLVMISSFISLGLVFGLINSYGVLYTYLQRIFAARNGQEASSKAALIGSITFGTTLLCSPVAGMLSDRIGMPLTTLIGAVLSVLGLLLSSVAPWNMTLLLFTYGILLGTGLSLVYTPTLSVLGIYFKRHLGKVNGFVSSGASIFTVQMPPILVYLLSEYGIRLTFQVLAGCYCFLIIAAFIYKPMICPTIQRVAKTPLPRFNFNVWRQKPYLTWSFSCAIGLFGYYSSYVHMTKFVEINFPRMNTSLPIMCLGAASGLGRLVVGFVADIPGINRIRFHQVALLGIGVITMLLPTVGSYNALIFCTMMMGVFDGMFFPVLGPICYQLCGPDGATQAIGNFLGIVAIPVMLGPVLAGKLYDDTGSYTLPFIISGIPSILGALFLCAVKVSPTHQPTDGLLHEKTISIVIESERGLNGTESSSPANKRWYRYSIL